MTLGATVVTYTVAPENADELRTRVAQHVVPAARSAPGYRGFLLFDQGDGKRLALVLFDSPEAALAAQRIIGPVGAKQTYALMSSPAVGALSTAIISDGVFG